MKSCRIVGRLLDSVWFCACGRPAEQEGIAVRLGLRDPVAPFVPPAPPTFSTMTGLTEKFRPSAARTGARHVIRAARANGLIMVSARDGQFVHARAAAKHTRTGPCKRGNTLSHHHPQWLQLMAAERSEFGAGSLSFSAAAVVAVSGRSTAIFAALQHHDTVDESARSNCSKLEPVRAALLATVSWC